MMYRPFILTWSPGCALGEVGRSMSISSGAVVTTALWEEGRVIFWLTYSRTH
jgi:hypothetical protein